MRKTKNIAKVAMVAATILSFLIANVIGEHRQNNMVIYAQQHDCEWTSDGYMDHEPICKKGDK
jgi:hypothetical protein